MKKLIFTFFTVFLLALVKTNAQTIPPQFFIAGYLKDTTSKTLTIYGDKFDTVTVDRSHVLTLQRKLNDTMYKRYENIYLVGVKPTGIVKLNGKVLKIERKQVMAGCACCTTPPYTCSGMIASCQAMGSCHPIENCSFCISYLR